MALAVGLTALVAGTAVAAASTVTATDGPLKASFTAKTHDPNCKQKWPITIKATFRGKPAHATAYYEFLLNGSVVSTQYPFSGSKKNPTTKEHPHGTVWHFVGSYTDNTFGPFGALASSVPTLTMTARSSKRGNTRPHHPSQYTSSRSAAVRHSELTARAARARHTASIGAERVCCRAGPLRWVSRPDLNRPRRGRDAIHMRCLA